MQEEFIVWPDAERRNKIANRFFVTHGLADCIGCIDGTLFNLLERPTWMGHDFFTRKNTYSVHALLVCDDESRINYIYTGWVGSVHDNRAWRNCNMKKTPSTFFSPRQYIIGDSAFNPEQHLIPSYKAVANIPLSQDKEFFNYKLNQGRTKIEHTIGILKSRFPCLRCLNIKIKKRNDIGKVVNIVLACAILHNFLLAEPRVEQEYYDSLAQELMEDPDLHNIRFTSEVDEEDESENRRTALFYLILSEFNYHGEITLV